VPGPAAVVGEGALSFSHSGERYILGYGQDFFGIWDRNVPGPAVLRFPRTDQGWGEAWGQFVAREPRSMTVPVTGAPQQGTGASSAAVFRDAHGRAVLLTILLAVTGVIDLVVAVVAVSLAGQLDRGERGVLSAVDRIQSFSGIAGLLLIGTIVVWCMWEFRARSNLDAFGASGLRISPGWSVGWWFIPFANLVMPYRAMSEVWRASGPSAAPDDWKRQPTGALLPIWWAVLLVGWIVTQSANSFVGQSTGPVLTLSETTTALRWVMIGQLVTAVAAVLAILVVRGIDRRQSERRSLAAGGSQTPAV
jgi:hypothetical protein